MIFFTKKREKKQEKTNTESIKRNSHRETTTHSFIHSQILSFIHHHHSTLTTLFMHSLSFIHSLDLSSRNQYPKAQHKAIQFIQSITHSPGKIQPSLTHSLIIQVYIPDLPFISTYNCTHTLTHSLTHPLTGGLLDPHTQSHSLFPPFQHRHPHTFIHAAASTHSLLSHTHTHTIPYTHHTPNTTHTP